MRMILSTPRMPKLPYDGSFEDEARRLSNWHRLKDYLFLTGPDLDAAPDRAFFNKHKLIDTPNLGLCGAVQYLVGLINEELDDLDALIRKRAGKLEEQQWDPRHARGAAARAVFQQRAREVHADAKRERRDIVDDSGLHECSQDVLYLTSNAELWYLIRRARIVRNAIGQEASWIDAAIRETEMIEASIREDWRFDVPIREAQKIKQPLLQRRVSGSSEKSGQGNGYN
ncbi:hypothetical protein K490DRAFT_67552 [Saccharata proteae CBS 121410]|uniref:Uncharacterized protein n=1 Tax=Saccharata proteae CBS 121410 TaxID=1314787 RepID=A0A9P4HUT6_9PEZI|nr:hypothetical protein K490DRAFT_67552 [Saccharata proteae CBS 121410]